MTEKIERVRWLVQIGLYSSEAAARMDIRRGKLPVIRRGRRIFVRPSDIEQWLEDGYCPPFPKETDPKGSCGATQE